MNWSAFENTHVLIVGGAGFVGSNLHRMLLQNVSSIRTTIVDNMMSANEVNIPKDERVNLLRGSITDDKILAQLEDNLDYVFHLATYHGNQSSIQNPLADHENNTFTTLKLFEHIKDFKQVKKVVYSSAGCSVAQKTFDDAEETTEDAGIEIKQDSPYSISKIIGEFYSVYYHKQHQLPTVRARFQNVYGPWEILGAGEWRGTPATIWRNVTPTFIYKALRGLPIPLQNQGIATRDFIFVDDIAKGLIACALNGKEGDVYNLASGKQTTIAQLAQFILQLTGSTSTLEFLAKRRWDNSGKRFGSTEKSESELGFKANIDIEEGLKITIEWTKQNLNFIESTMANHQKYLEKK